MTENYLHKHLEIDATRKINSTRNLNALLGSHIGSLSCKVDLVTLPQVLFQKLIP